MEWSIGRAVVVGRVTGRVVVVGRVSGSAVVVGRVVGYGFARLVTWSRAVVDASGVKMVAAGPVLFVTGKTVVDTGSRGEVDFFELQ